MLRVKQRTNCELYARLVPLKVEFRSRDAAPIPFHEREKGFHDGEGQSAVVVVACKLDHATRTDNSIEGDSCVGTVDHIHLYRLPSNERNPKRVDVGLPHGNP